jgi:ubiquinol-cytochrome c reductase cytochrome c subunit
VLVLVVGFGGLLGLVTGASAATTVTATGTGTTAPTPLIAPTPTPTPTPVPKPAAPGARPATGKSACTSDAAKISHPGPATSGSPANSKVVTCRNGKVLSYGNTAITYDAPTPKYVAAGESLFEAVCSSCHLADAQGGTKAPSLIGVGPATVNFWVTTGRMPAATPLSTEALRKPPRLSDQQADEIAAFINSLSPSAPYIPAVNVKGADLAAGSDLFALNCASCHTITGMGDELAYGTSSPSLHKATATQIAEAIRTGPGNMPRFAGNLSDSQVRDVVAYVTEKIQHPTNPGGAGLGGVGPVAEGFVALLFGVGGLMLVCFWIGDRA